MVKRTIPAAQTSEAWPSYFSLAHISGDIYAGVPQNTYIFVTELAANPKSMILVSKFGEVISTKILSGLISLCATF